MSRKRFLIWGLGLIHLYVSVMAVMSYLYISRTVPIEVAETALSPASICNITLIVTFGILLWKRFRRIGQRKRTLIWCLLFHLVAVCIAVFPITVYLNTSEFFSNAMMSIVNTRVAGDEVTFWMNVRFVLYLVPGFYLGNWGLFALLWFGSRDPKAPTGPNWFTRFKRAPKQIPLQSDPILVNGTWLVKH